MYQIQQPLDLLLDNTDVNPQVDIYDGNTPKGKFTFDTVSNISSVKVSIIPPNVR